MAVEQGFFPRASVRSVATDPAGLGGVFASTLPGEAALPTVVTWAQLTGLEVLDLEFARPGRPNGGRFRNRRVDRRRFDWVRPKVVKHAGRPLLVRGIPTAGRKRAMWTMPEAWPSGGEVLPGWRAGGTGHANGAAALSVGRLSSRWGGS